MVKLYISDRAKIDELIAMNGYTQKSLSDKVDIIPSYLSAILNGKRSAGVKTAKKISGRLGVEISDIFFAQDVYKSYTK
ncbi:helix-turn-helix transcriptional regulator [Lapidilactobacillus achengensis]|uniref:Helix-turn-helix transcriptional regulator n=1 Tax=Lapidilactobacillus achengensis TaxID=2486000 RepID=A0ABW1UQF6_9LACO|nr:helix-turn-helix transcriptional regulator [Lapidilactobacillus achengensis]